MFNETMKKLGEFGAKFGLTNRHEDKIDKKKIKGEFSRLAPLLQAPINPKLVLLRNRVTLSKLS